MGEGGGTKNPLPYSTACPSFFPLPVDLLPFFLRQKKRRRRRNRRRLFCLLGGGGIFLSPPLTNPSFPSQKVEPPSPPFSITFFPSLPPTSFLFGFRFWSADARSAGPPPSLSSFSPLPAGCPQKRRVYYWGSPQKRGGKKTSLLISGSDARVRSVPARPSFFFL